MRRLRRVRSPIRRPRLVAAALTCCVVATAGAVSYAAAATLGAGSDTLGTGQVAVPPCDGDGFTYTRTLDANHNITSVTVSGIAAACSGGTLQIALANSGGTALGSGTAAVSGSGWVTVSITGTAPAANVTDYHVVITN